MRIAPLTISSALVLALTGIAIGQQPQPQPAPGQGVQPAPWRKFPTGLGGVPAGTAPANPGQMLDRTPARHRFPAQPQPVAPSTPATGALPGGFNLPIGAQTLANRPFFVVTTPSFNINGGTGSFGDIGPWRGYRTSSGLSYFDAGSGAFTPLGGAILRRYSGDSLDFGARISTPALNPCAPQPTFVIPPTFRGTYSGWDDAFRRWYDDRSDYVLVGNFASDGFALRAPAPEPAQATAPPLTTMQRAAEALQRGDALAAASLYQQRLQENENDALAHRGLALALLEDRKIDQAVAVMGQSYVRYPWLAGMPIQASSLPGTERDLRSRFNAVMTYANRAGTASSLLAAAVLAQAEDRPDVALKLVDRAEASGLEPKVASAMRTALGK